MQENESTKESICFIATIDIAVKAFLTDHIRALAPFYKITVITTTEEPGFLAASGVDVRLIRLNLKRKIAPVHDLVALLHLYSLFRKHRFTIIHSITPKGGLLSMIAGCLAGVRFRVHTFTGQIWVTRSGVMRSLLKFTDKLIAGFATNILVDSWSQRDFLIKSKVISEANSAVLANGSICGVDTDRFCPDHVARKRIRDRLGICQTDVAFLYVGRLTFDKGLIDLARSFADISADNGSVYLLIVGPDEEGLRRKMTEICSGCRDRIRFEDYTGYPEHYMAAADVLCLPSYREGFGNVIIEAAAVGIPSIGSRVYGITDAIEEGVTGLVFEPGDVKALSTMMVRMVENPGVRKEMGSQARKRVIRDFSSHLVISAMHAYYESLSGRKVAATYNVRYSLSKRLFDLGLALLLSVVLIIPVLLIGLVVKLTSRGPAIYWSDRIGACNTIFRMPKFRTMYTNTPVVATHLLENAGAHVTPFGYFLRKFSLDEVPQLWSVLTGSMSFVGPRPALYNQDDLVALRTGKNVHLLVPGITGWAQINGRDGISIPQKVELDEYYAKNKSFRFDVRILYMTLIKALKSEGVSH